MQPDLSILPLPQLLLFPELVNTPSHFVLCGGTAIALRLGHRVSVDFDFFSKQPIDPDLLYREIPYLRDSEIIDKREDTLTCLVNRQGWVKLSFFGGLPFDYIEAPEMIDEINVKIASLIDLSGMKVAVVQKRAALRDYVDIDAMMTEGIALEAMLAAGQLLYGMAFNATITLKALTYYIDGDLTEVSSEARSRIIQAVKSLDAQKISDLSLLFRKKREVNNA